MAISNLLAKCSLEESWLRNYTLEEFINSGSYGGVYKAVNKTTNKRSAVKITYLQKHLLDGGASTENLEEVRDKMNREYLLLVGKKHQNIVNVYDGLEIKLNKENINEMLKSVTNAEDIDAKHVRNNFEYWAAKTGLDALFIRMELCGMTLRQWINNAENKGAGLRITQILITKHLLNGLQYLHENKILHRDLKSENIFLTFDETDEYYGAKIGDFGIGRIIHSDESRTSAQTMKPTTTPLYKAPELETGNEYTLQADLFSLGLLIFELINMLKSNDRKLEFARIRTKRIDLDFPNEPFINARAVILQLTESDTNIRLKTVKQVKLIIPEKIILGRKVYSKNSLSKIAKVYKFIIGDKKGGTGVIGDVVFVCKNRVIQNVVFRSGLCLSGKNNELFNVTFAPDREKYVHLNIRGNDNNIKDIKMECPECLVVLFGNRNKVSNVFALGNTDSTPFTVTVWSGVGHRIQNILIRCKLVFSDSTSSCTVENVKCWPGSSLHGRNHILTNVDCNNLKVEGNGHKFVNCRGSVKKSPKSNYEFINCTLSFENL